MCPAWMYVCMIAGPQVLLHPPWPVTTGILVHENLLSQTRLYHFAAQGECIRLLEDMQMSLRKLPHQSQCLHS